MLCKAVVPLLCVVATLLPLMQVEGCGRGSVFLRNNGYRKLLVAIDDDVPEDVRLLDRIKELFVNASRLLFSVSRRRAYFHDVHVLIPESWDDRADYSAPTWQQLDQSEVAVGPVVKVGGQGQGVASDAPFTVRSTPCGELGHVMHFTPAYILNDTLAAAYGPYDKVFLHEWSHLRYGVFDEYADHDDNVFYAGRNGELEGVRCPELLEGQMWDTVSQSQYCGFDNGLPDSQCQFQPDMDSLPDNAASLMFHVDNAKVSQWCDDDVSSPETLHNRLAPSQHNRQCGGRSVWEVVRGHGDFRAGQNPPSNLTVPPDPVFTLVKRRSPRTVLVLDVSGSMEDNDRIGRLRQAASNYLLRVTRDGDRVGIVWFSSTASIRVTLTEVTNATRQDLLQHVPTDAQGGTSIGDGLQKGLEVLRQPDDVDGGALILLSDGQETHAPWVKDVIPTARANSVTIHTIAVSSQAADSLELAAMETGGLSFAYSDNTPSNALNDAFLAMASAGVSPKQQKIPLLSLTKTLRAGDYDVTTFVIDPTANDDVTVAINYAENMVPHLVLTSPSGRQFTDASPEYKLESLFNTVYMSLGQAAETGEYRLNVTNVGLKADDFYVTVTSTISPDEAAPIFVTAQWRHKIIADPSMHQALYVSVSKGYAPVLQAQVVARIENPPVTSSAPATSSVLRLLDNGAGSDVTKDDGIYSSYVTTFTAKGRYNVHVTVRDVMGTVVSEGTVGVGAPPSVSSQGGGAGGRRGRRPVDPFQRFSSAGSFSLQNYDDTWRDRDLFPPSPILDLAVSRLDHIGVELTWTAPGADLDRGTAAGYVVRMTSDVDALYANHSLVSGVRDHLVVSGSLHSPRPSGQRETVTIYVGIDSDTHYFLVQAYDNSSNMAPASNIVSATTTLHMRTSTSPVLWIVIVPIATVALAVAVVGVAMVLRHQRAKSKDLEKQRVKVMQQRF